MSDATSHNSSSPSRSGKRAPNGTDGVVRNRSIFSATRSTLSDPTARPKDSPASDSPKTLLQSLPSAAQALRYEAVLDAFGHMGKDVIIEEFSDYASARNPVPFACVRPIDGGHLEVGISLDSSEDDALEPCAGQWSSDTITSKFMLGNQEPISGKQLRWIRLASRAVAAK